MKKESENNLIDIDRGQKMIHNAAGKLLSHWERTFRLVKVCNKHGLRIKMHEPIPFLRKICQAKWNAVAGEPVGRRRPRLLEEE